jgi:HAD superfamily hydrolase (TIGR01509 family)
MAITTLLLDADGVLQHPPFGWHQRILDLTGARDWHEIALVEGPLMTGQEPVADAFTAGFPRRSVDVAHIIAYWNHTVVDAMALELVDAVRARGVTVALASNQQVHRARHMREELPYSAHLDSLFFSSEVGLAKPDPAFFAHIVGELGVDAAETLFVDDMPENVEGARTAGLIAERAPRDNGAAGLRAILVRHGLL